MSRVYGKNVKSNWAAQPNHYTPRIRKSGTNNLQFHPWIPV